MEDPVVDQSFLFENPKIDLRQLPTVPVEEYVGLDPSYLKLIYWRTLLFFFILLAIANVVLFLSGSYALSNWFWVIPGGLVLLMAYSLFLARRRFKREGYLVRQYDILHRKGVLWQTETFIPFNRIQHCALSRGPIEKSIGLATLQIFTAGGDSSDLSISGLRYEEAERLKHFLLKKIGEDEH